MAWLWGGGVVRLRVGGVVWWRGGGVVQWRGGMVVGWLNASKRSQVGVEINRCARG